MQHIKTPYAPEPGPYAQAVLVDTHSNHLLFLAGQTGNVPGVKDEPVIAGGVFEQTLQALTNLLAVVVAAGGGPHSFVSLDVFLKDSKTDPGFLPKNIIEKKEFEKAYQEFFEKHLVPRGELPARCLVFVADVPLPFPIENTLVEIRGVAEIL